MEMSGINPWVHYVLQGKNEGRDNGIHPTKEIFNEDVYRALYPDLCFVENHWIHYVIYGKKEKRLNGVFCELISDILLSNS